MSPELLDILKLLGILALIIVLLRSRLNLGLILLFASLLTAEFYGLSRTDLAISIGEAMVDWLTLRLLAVGAVGCVGVATHWTGIEHRDMMTALDKGDLAEARRINASLLQSFAVETGLEAPNPIPTKAMMRVVGLQVGKGRPPMDVEPPGLELSARAVLAGTAVGAELGLA